jgi:2,4-dienoyl-CoA reductase-like NADH-dependent reductase (Old Yellow Enzyme family)
MLDTLSLSDSRLKFFVGLNTGYVIDGAPDERLIEFHRRRSSPRLHCAIVGNVVLPGGYGTNSNTPRISKAQEWRRLANAIADNGSLPGIQLSTTWADYSGSKRFRSKEPGQVITRLRDLVRELGDRKILSTLSSLKEGADLALDAGFRHLQVHAAHGYLFSLLIDDRLNECASQVRVWLEDFASGLSANGIETSIRISVRTGDPQFDAVGRDKFHAQIAALPFDFIDVSSGYYDIDKQLIYPGRPDTLRQRREDTLSLALNFSARRFIFSGRALRESVNDLPPNLHIGLCRDLLANPDYLIDGSRGCINSGKCHYFSRDLGSISCSQWVNQAK